MMEMMMRVYEITTDSQSPEYHSFHTSHRAAKKDLARDPEARGDFDIIAHNDACQLLYDLQCRAVHAEYANQHVAELLVNLLPHDNGDIAPTHPEHHDAIDWIRANAPDLAKLHRIARD